MTIEDLLLHAELRSLQERYCAAIDGDRIEAWPAFFLEDGHYEIIAKENEDAGLPAPLMLCRGAAMMRDRVISLRHANIYEQPVYRHFLGGITVEPETADAVRMTLNYLVVNTSQAGDSTIYQAGVFRDRAVRTADGWRFAAKRAVYDTLRVQTLLAYPV